ncbi:hypothetical protein DPMN_101447 [Dreissena polymorpha]|uniref:Uncharacterized protein n=1 Tax=Dreissena polymorpha TaxID=45954 RepID=A0A9D4R8B6_DREPO|nr:hypothetical protein DPMN_101447 [Dreissena polymorpha]
MKLIDKKPGNLATNGNVIVQQSVIANATVPPSGSTFPVSNAGDIQPAKYTTIYVPTLLTAVPENSSRKGSRLLASNRCADEFTPTGFIRCGVEFTPTGF